MLPILIDKSKRINETNNFEFVISNGEIIEIRIKESKGFKPLKGTDLKNFKEFLSIYANEIVKKWIDYFVYHKDIDFERITKKDKMKIIEQYPEKQLDRIEIGAAKYIGDYAIRIKFKDGTEKLVDFKPFLNKSQHPAINKYLKEDVAIETCSFCHT